ncbi:MAG: TRAP transporter substrate-binding protein [Cytophagales bacterium]|nr:TRAP transporter substrate-binding protein [Cytophagales bacterium]
MSTTRLSGFLLLLSLLLAGCGEIGKVTTIKLAHGLNVDHSVHKAMVYMGERLKERSGGKMHVAIYPNQQLGTERQLLELLQIGSVGMTKVSVGVMENFAPNMKVFGLPFIFRDKEHAYNVMDGEIGRELLLQGEDYWLRGLTYYDAGSRSFYTKERPIYTPDDLSGLKIRVMESATAMDMVRSLGGSPTPISWGELYTALQQGVVDGAENNPPSFYLSGHYEVCKYYTLNEHTTLPDVLLIGTHVWDRLSPEEQEWLQAAVDDSAVYQRKLWAESEQEALDAVKEAGVEIIIPDKSTFKKEVTQLIESYKNDNNIYSLIQRIQETE